MREKSIIFQVLYYCTTAKLPSTDSANAAIATVVIVAAALGVVVVAIAACCSCRSGL